MDMGQNSLRNTPGDWLISFETIGDLLGGTPNPLSSITLGLSNFSKAMVCGPYLHGIKHWREWGWKSSRSHEWEWKSKRSSPWWRWKRVRPPLHFGIVWEGNYYLYLAFLINVHLPMRVLYIRRIMWLMLRPPWLLNHKGPCRAIITFSSHSCYRRSMFKAPSTTHSTHQWTKTSMIIT